MALPSLARKSRSLLLRGLRPVAAAFPRLSLALTSRFADPDAMGLTLDQLSALFPELSRDRLAAARPAIAAQERRNALLFLLVAQRSIQALWPLVSVRDAGGLEAVRGGPTVLVLWHAGVPLVEIPAVAKVGVPAVIPEPANPYHPVPSVRFYNIHASREGRLQFLKHGLEHLRKGTGPVLFFLDRPVGDSGIEVEFLGGRLRLGKGAASLARMSGARVVPVTSCWAEGSASRVEVVFHPPLPEPDVPRKARAEYEHAVLSQAAGWFERYLREHPERLRVLFSEDWLGRSGGAAAPGDGGPAARSDGSPA